MRTINLTTDIPLNRQVWITLPPDVPTGPAELVVVVAPRQGAPAKTLGDLAQSEFCGMWRDRTDMEDSVEYARRLRQAAWRRAA